MDHERVLIDGRTDARPGIGFLSGKGGSALPHKEHPMAKKKQTKSVLKKIGSAVATGTEAVIDAGAKAIHAVGEMLPTGKTPPKGAKAKAAKAKSPKAAAKAPKAAAKAKAPAAKAKPKVAAPTAKKAAAKGATAPKSAKPAAKAAPSPKKNSSVAKKG